MRTKSTVALLDLWCEIFPHLRLAPAPPLDFFGTLLFLKWRPAKKAKEISVEMRSADGVRRNLPSCTAKIGTVYLRNRVHYERKEAGQVGLHLTCYVPLILNKFKFEATVIVSY